MHFFVLRLLFHVWCALDFEYRMCSKSFLLCFRIYCFTRPHTLSACHYYILPSVWGCIDTVHSTYVGPESVNTVNTVCLENIWNVVHVDFLSFLVLSLSRWWAYNVKWEMYLNVYDCISRYMYCSVKRMGWSLAHDEKSTNKKLQHLPNEF